MNKDLIRFLIDLQESAGDFQQFVKQLLLNEDVTEEDYVMYDEEESTESTELHGPNATKVDSAVSLLMLEQVAAKLETLNEFYYNKENSYREQLGEEIN